ncbi:hypothetical protein Angca_001056, partial [Angiostrongylus cantonensis]
VSKNDSTQVFCPELVRVGTTNDGGKWICSPFRIPLQCKVVSLGLYNEVTFERELQYITNSRCIIYGYDMNEQSPETKEILGRIRTKTRKATISNTTDVTRNMYTLNYLMKLESISELEILKADIE